MATIFFENQDVGNLLLFDSTKMFGTLVGDVTRTGNTVTLSNMKIKLTCVNPVSGSSLPFTMTVGGVGTTFDIVGDGTTDLGEHALDDCSFSVAKTQTSAQINWSTSRNASGSFTVSFPDNFESRFYGPVNGHAKRIIRLYGEKGGQIKRIVKLYGSVDGKTKRVL